MKPVSSCHFSSGQFQTSVIKPETSLRLEIVFQYLRYLDIQSLIQPKGVVIHSIAFAGAPPELMYQALSS